MKVIYAKIFFTEFRTYMKIGAIQNSYILPVFTSSKIQAPHIIHGNSYDSFEKAPYSFQNDLEDYYKQLEKNMGIVTENDVKLMAQNVSISTGIDIKDVYKTMGRLSAYSSYKSLDIFKKYFNQNEIRIVSNILPYFEPYNNKGWAPTLTNVMNYILHRNFAFAHDREAFTFYKKALFIDSKFLEIVKNMSDDERQVFNVKFLNKDNIKEIYVEDFENGYNFLNQDESFEKYTIKILNKAKKSQRINGKDINGNDLKGNYIGSDIPMANGFNANAVFFKLGFLDKTTVSLGLQFKELLPLLWLKAGGWGKCPDDETVKIESKFDLPPYIILPENKLAVLINEDSFTEFNKLIKNEPLIKTVYIVTDYENGFVAMKKKLDIENVIQLYRDYLDNFRINVARR